MELKFQHSKALNTTYQTKEDLCGLSSEELGSDIKELEEYNKFIVAKAQEEIQVIEELIKKIALAKYIVDNKIDGSVRIAPKKTKVEQIEATTKELELSPTLPTDDTKPRLGWKTGWNQLMEEEKPKKEQITLDECFVSR